MNPNDTSPYTAPNYGSVPQDPTPPTPVKRRRWVLPVAVFAALVAGVGIGGASTATAEPEVITETKEVEVVKEVEVEVPGPTEYVETTPQVCVDALAEADFGFLVAAEVSSLAGEGFGYAADAMDAVINYDVGALNASTEGLTGVRVRMDEQTALLNASKYRALADQCLLLVNH